jgi:hypothetical protein
MEHYKSWAGLNKQLTGMLCDAYQRRITYFLTRYHDVHNAYGRAAVLLDGHELAAFSWTEMYHQEADVAAAYKEDSTADYGDLYSAMKPKWDADCTYNEMDFLSAALQFRSMAIEDALHSDNFIIRIFAILDRRVGTRTLRQIAADGTYKALPQWVRQFYELRLAEI